MARSVRLVATLAVAMALAATASANDYGRLVDRGAVAEEIDEAEDLDVVVEVPASENGNGDTGDEEKPWYVPERASRRRSSE